MRQIIALGGGGFSMEPLHCLGFLKGSNCPHYDGVAIHYIEQEISKIVSSRPTSKAYRV